MDSATTAQGPFAVEEPQEDNGVPPVPHRGDNGGGPHLDEDGKGQPPAAPEQHVGAGQ